MKYLIYILGEKEYFHVSEYHFLEMDKIIAFVEEYLSN
jgi:hypothetical protein